MPYMKGVNIVNETFGDFQKGLKNNEAKINQNIV